MLVDRGLVELNAPVAKYWPEFAANGKGDIEFRHLLSHSAGVSGWELPFEPEDMYDWEKSTATATPGRGLGFCPLFRWAATSMTFSYYGARPSRRFSKCSATGLISCSPNFRCAGGGIRLASARHVPVRTRQQDLLLGRLGWLVGVMNPDHRATFAYVMNKMGPGIEGSERTARYARLFYETLG